MIKIAFWLYRVPNFVPSVILSLIAWWEFSINQRDIVHIFSCRCMWLFSPSICLSLKLNVKINCFCIVNAFIVCDIAFTMCSNSWIKINPTWLEECHCRNIWFFPGSCWDVDFRQPATFPRFPLLITLTCYFKTGLHNLLNYCYTVAYQ
jgi:hypothetical protein